MNFFFFSDVWLDQADTLRGLQKIFDNCIENNFIPKVIVFCGNFTSSGIAQGNSRDIQKYQGKWFPPPPYVPSPQSLILPFCFVFLPEGFDSLADLIASYTLITRRTHFVFVPGPLDLTVNSVLPRKPLLASFTARLRSKIPNVHLASNPCRLKFFGQEIVVYRDDVMSRMLRNLVGVKCDARNEDLKRYVCAHPPLFNLADAHVRSRHTARPVYTRPEPPRPIHDAHTTDPSRIRPRDASLSFTHMRAYGGITPLLHQPSTQLFFFVLRFRKTGFWRPILQVVLADKYDSYRMTYEGCHVFNPGRFVGRSLGFSTYTPATRESEAWFVFIHLFPLPSQYPVRGTAHSDLPSVVDLEAEN